MKILVTLNFLFFLSLHLFSQQEEFKTVFTPHTVTYNGSDNPNECWESVDYGILINNQFFLLPPDASFQKLSDELKGKEVLIEVFFFEDATEESGAIGIVSKIIFGGKTYFLLD